MNLQPERHRSRSDLQNSTTPAALIPGDLRPEQFIDTALAADLISVTPAWLRQLRVTGGGPRFSRLAAKAVRYRVADVLDWAASKSMRSTSEAEAA